MLHAAAWRGTAHSQAMVASCEGGYAELLCELVVDLNWSGFHYECPHHRSSECARGWQQFARSCL